MLAPSSMLTAIDLDDQTGLEADKIDGVSAHRNLSAKLQTFTLPIAESLPKAAFSVSLMPS